MAKKGAAAPPASDVSPFEETFEEQAVETTGPTSGRSLKPEEMALAVAGGPVDPLNPEEKKHPKYGTPRKAGPGPVPRICHPLERAGDEQKRFKIRAQRASEQQPIRYILATTKDEAVAFYLSLQKLDVADKNLAVTVTELPD